MKDAGCRRAEGKGGGKGKKEDMAVEGASWKHWPPHLFFLAV
jgi:hypothetical protein